MARTPTKEPTTPGHRISSWWAAARSTAAISSASSPIQRIRPTFAIGGQYSTDNRGRIIPSHSVDEYMAELIKWFGDFSDSDLEMILPSYSKFAGRTPIGHMA